MSEVTVTQKGRGFSIRFTMQPAGFVAVARSNGSEKPWSPEVIGHTDPELPSSLPPRARK